MKMMMESEEDEEEEEEADGRYKCLEDSKTIPSWLITEIVFHVWLTQVGLFTLMVCPEKQLREKDET